MNIDELRLKIQETRARQPEHGTPAYTNWFQHLSLLRRELYRLEAQSADDQHKLEANRKLEIMPL